jgi:hypothetical protein
VQLRYDLTIVLGFALTLLVSQSAVRVIQHLPIVDATPSSSVRKRRNKTVKGDLFCTVPTSRTSCTVGTMVPIVQVPVQEVLLVGIEDKGSQSAYSS